MGRAQRFATHLSWHCSAARRALQLSWSDAEASLEICCEQGECGSRSSHGSRQCALVPAASSLPTASRDARPSASIRRSISVHGFEPRYRT